MKLLVTLIFINFITIQAHASLNNKISSYENSSSVAITINKLRQMVLPNSKGLCAKYVRLGFMASGLIPIHPQINFAKNYKPYFNNNGWTNLYSPKAPLKWKNKIDKDLFNAPSGCAVVYDAINPKNDRNGHIGHIETRIKNHQNTSKWGFMSDYFAPNSRAGLKCLKKGKVVKRLKVFKARPSSPYYAGNKKVKIYVAVTECSKYSKSATSVSDEWKNRKVIGVHCKL